MGRRRSSRKPNRSTRDRAQTVGSVLLIVSGLALPAPELWAAWFASLNTLTAILAAGSAVCASGTALCWHGRGTTTVHIIAGWVSMILGAGCGYILTDVSGVDAIIATVGVVFFTSGGTLLTSGQGDPLSAGI